MLELKLGNTALRLDFSFFAVLSVFFFFDTEGIGVSALCACFCHEMGHLTVMTAAGAAVREITLYGAGVRINAELSKLSYAARASVYAAGCVVNLVLYAVSCICGNVVFALVNLALAVFNLLPLGELDGAQLIKLLLQRYLPHMADRISGVLGSAAAVVCVGVLVAAGGNIGITFAVCLGYFILLMSRKT